MTPCRARPPLPRPRCPQTQDLVLFKMEPPPEPWSPPSNLWMYWGAAPNKRFGHSGDNVRHLVKLGRLAGGEYRDPHFLFDFDSQTFRDLSESCCTAMLMPPMKNNMPIWNTYANVAQRLRNYVANGNHLILTGGSLVSIEFLNRYLRGEMPIRSGGSSSSIAHAALAAWFKARSRITVCRAKRRKRATRAEYV